MNKLIITILSATILAAFTATGQTFFTLDKCIEYAIDNNPDIFRKKIALEQARNNLLQAKMDLLPALSAEVSHNVNWGRSVDLQELEIIKNNKTQALSASIGISANLFDGLRRINAIKSRQAGISATESALEEAKDKLIIDVIHTFLQVLLSKWILNDALVAHAGISEQKQKTALAVDVGGRPYGDLLEISCRAAVEKANVTKAAGELKIAILTLKQIINLPDSVDMEIDWDEKEQASEIVPDIDLASIVSMPQVKKAGYALKMSRSDLAAVRGKFAPELNISAGFGSYYSDAAKGRFSDQFQENINPSISLTLTIPIFNRMSTFTDLRNAELAVKSAESEYGSALLDAKKIVTEAVCEALNLRDMQESAKESLKYVEETFLYASMKFNLGELSPSEYITARMNLEKAGFEYHQAKYRYLFQSKILEHYRKILDR